MSWSGSWSTPTCSTRSNGGGVTLEFQVNPEFGSVEAALDQVDVYAPALGRLPAALLSRALEMSSAPVALKLLPPSTSARPAR